MKWSFLGHLYLHLKCIYTVGSLESWTTEWKKVTYSHVLIASLLLAGRKLVKHEIELVG